MSKRVIGLDLGSNSIGWAFLEQTGNGNSGKIVDLGSRIFTKAVEEKVPTPKNAKRRDMRLGRRLLQRSARRRQRMINYLISLKLLPVELQGHPQPEVILNDLGNPYKLRAEALERQLTAYEFGRVLLHFAARRGFLSSKKQLAGDLIDDPDTLAYLNTLEADDNSAKDKEESAYKADIAEVNKAIQESGNRTLGEYLYHLETGKCKRNRSHAGGHLRTDRKMYQDELMQIWQQQSQYFTHLPTDFMQDNKGVKQIIFYQRPLKLNPDRVGKGSLESNNYRAATARLEVQRFRYLQDVNNLQYFENNTEQWLSINEEAKQKLGHYFENNKKITIAKLKQLLGFDRKTSLNLETKNLKGNITACEIRAVLGKIWDGYSPEQQYALVEDLLSIKKKSALKTRLITHWNLDKLQAVQLCLIEFEPGHSSHSLKAIKRLLVYLEQGDIYSSAREKASYGYEPKTPDVVDKLPAPPETANPIVNRGLHELKRLVNALIKQYGKPDFIRIEMARDLEMNTKRYQDHQKQQNKNKKQNEAAVAAYQDLKLGNYPSYDDKIKYRLWQQQNQQCIYSGKQIPLSLVFTAQVETDHILPYKKSLDDSYMNKVLCYSAENRQKGDKTPKDTWGGNAEKWDQITQALSRWERGLEGKKNRFYKTEADLQQPDDFIHSQLTDTRYIAKIALDYLKQLGCTVTTSKGITTATLRHQWGLDDLIGETNKKERTDHRHHAIDAAVVACVDPKLYKKIKEWIEESNTTKFKVSSPFPDFRAQLQEKLQQVIVSHGAQQKLAGELHEATGTGFIEKHGGLVYRKTLAPDFTKKDADKIIDPSVKQLVLAHLALYDNDSKQAFADNKIIYHKDGKTPIKRVRVLQSKTTLEKLERSKFGVKDKSGNTFKWMTYGNIHHVEILKHKKTGKYRGEFVTMMQASHRAKGISSVVNPSGHKQPIIKMVRDDDWQYVMALHRNDVVSILDDDTRKYYRIQKFEAAGKITLRLNTAATLENQHEFIAKAINILMAKYKMQKHAINIIGRDLTDD